MIEKVSKVKQAVILACCLAVGGCKQAPQANVESGYKVMTLAPADRTLSSTYSATIRGRQDIEIYPQVGGTLTQVCVSEGERVKRGQSLFVIDQVPYEAALQTALANVEAAKASLATAQLTYDSKQELYRQNVVSAFDLSTAKNSLLAAQAQLAQMKAQEVNARNNLSYTLVKSPADGVVGTLPYRVGALVSASLPERSDYPQAGRIETISGVIDRTTGTVSLRAVFPNREGLLHSGGAGNVIVPTEKTGALVIPQAATFEVQDKVFVYKVVDGKAQSAPVQVTRVNGGQEYIVESGLQTGDVIVAEGVGLLREGTEIKAVNEER